MWEIKIAATTLQPGDAIRYERHHDRVTFRRNGDVLRIRTGDDAEPLSLVLVGHFWAFCRLAGHVTGLTVAGTDLRDTERVWSCTFGERRPDPSPMPLRAGDTLRFEARDMRFSIVRDGAELYRSANELWLSMHCFEQLSLILASCCGLLADDLMISREDRDDWRITLDAPLD